MNIKRSFTLALSVLFVFGFAACGSKHAENLVEDSVASSQTEENVISEESTEPKEAEFSEGASTEQTEDGKTLVVYFPCQKL